MRIKRRTALKLAGAAALVSGCAPGRSSGQDADVIIIGSGLSGLNAARLLFSEGMKVIVLEAADRPGGRMRTLYDMPGMPEAGGTQVGQTYARVRSTADDLGLVLKPFPDTGPRTRTMAVEGQVFNETEWAMASENPFPEAMKRLSPDSALFAAGARANPFADNYAWRDTAPERDISADRYLDSIGFNGDARRLCDIALNANSLETYSMVNLWRSLTLYREDSGLGASERFEGGSSALTLAMAQSLNGSVRLKTQVQAIEVENENSVVVTTDKGNLRARKCIAALPFPALGKIRIDAPILPETQAAMADLPYTQIQQIYLSADDRFWERDGLPASMWTDTPIERVFPVNDNETGEIVGLNCWVNGSGTRLDASDADWFALAERTLADLRGAKVKGLKVVRWDRNQPFSGGAYMHWAPGQVANWAGKMGQPAGSLHFAGEHLSYLHTGMEGAMESGERAAFEVMDALSPT